MQSFDRLDFQTDGAHWPLRELSTFVTVDGVRFHVQRAGYGPAILLLHGTGASTHSFRGLIPLLSQRFTVVVPDLPGHGFSEPLPGRPSLQEMSRALGAMLAALEVKPAIAGGHSAGAAVAVKMALEGNIRPEGLVSINGALQPYAGSAGPLFSAVAKALFVNPLAPRLFAFSASRRRVARMLANTGSPLNDEGVQLYATLFRSPGHVASALSMMANWDLHGLQKRLLELDVPLLLIAADGDRAVAPTNARTMAKRARRTQLVRVPRLGHLAHEEDPPAFARMIGAFADEIGVGRGSAALPMGSHDVGRSAQGA